MIRTILRGPIICLLICLAGCSQQIVGNWRSIEPAQVPPEIARIRQVTFDSNGQFHARLLQQHRLASVAGTYQFTGDKLVLLPAGSAPSGQYDYDVRRIGNVLVLTQNSRTYRLCRDAAGSSTTQPVPSLTDSPTSRPEATASPTTPASRSVR